MPSADSRWLISTRLPYVSDPPVSTSYSEPLPLLFPVFPPGGRGGGAQHPLYRVHAAQDSSICPGINSIPPFLRETLLFRSLLSSVLSLLLFFHWSYPYLVSFPSLLISPIPFPFPFPHFHLSLTFSQSHTAQQSGRAVSGHLRERQENRARVC